MWNSDEMTIGKTHPTLSSRAKPFQDQFRSKTIDLTSLLVEKDYKILAEELSKIEIGILFNNAGIAEYKGWFQN